MRICPPTPLFQAIDRRRRCWRNISTRKSSRVTSCGTFGNTGRDILRGPGSANFDWSLFKNIPIAESRYVQFRAEFFNLANHPALGSRSIRSRTLNSGKILSAGSPRIIQLAAKLVF